MATRAEAKRRRAEERMTLFEEKPKRTTRKAMRDKQAAKRAAERAAAPVEEKSGTYRAGARKAARDKQSEKRAAERAAEAKKPKVTGGRGRAAGKKSVIGKTPAKPKVQKKAPGADAAAELGAANIALNKKQDKAKPKRKSVVKRILLGKDEKFGGDRGLIDFLPGKSRPKKKVKRTGSAAKMSKRKFAGGGMASKMSAKGGARGGKKMPGGMKNGGSASKFPDLTGDGRVTQADILKGRGVTKKKNGGIMKPKGMRRGGRVMAEPEMPTLPSRSRRRGTPKPPVNPNLTPATRRRRGTPAKLATLDAATRRRGKTPTATPTPNVDGATRRRGKTPNMPPMPKLPGGMKNGGMAKKGYSKGGAVRKSKPRGVGVALRGYGKALR